MKPTLLLFALLFSIAGYSDAWTAKLPTDSLDGSASQLSNPPSSTDPGKVVAVREVTLKAGVDPDEFERFAAEEFTPTFSKYVPGVRAFILKGNRGDRKDNYAFVLVFDSQSTRDFYFPREHEGETSVQGTALELWKPGQEMIRGRLMEYVDGISETEGYTDYVPLGPAAQPAVHAGDVVALRAVTLKAGGDPAEFERFAVEELSPTFDQYVPGVKAFLLKGNRGDRKGGYLFVLIFDSINTRNFYFPSRGSGEFNMPEEPLSLWRPGQRVIMDRLLGYVVALGGGATVEHTGGFTDYVVLG